MDIKGRGVPKNSYVALGIIGTFLILIGGGYLTYRRTVLSFASPPADFQTQERKALPQKITIPALKLEKAIEPTQITNGVWQIPDKNAAFLTSSARPGEGGNIVVYGHNKKVIFGPLVALRKSSLITITTEDGNKYSYTVDSIQKVKPDRIDLVSPTNFEVLTLYTCTGLFDTERLVVKALPAINID